MLGWPMIAYLLQYQAFLNSPVLSLSFLVLKSHWSEVVVVVVVDSVIQRRTDTTGGPLQTKPTSKP